MVTPWKFSSEFTPEDLPFNPKGMIDRLPFPSWLSGASCDNFGGVVGPLNIQKVTPPETNSSHLKMDGQWWCGLLFVSGRRPFVTSNNRGPFVGSPGRPYTWHRFHPCILTGDMSQGRSTPCSWGWETSNL